MTIPIVDRLAHLHPCSPAVAWLGDRTDLEQAWADCPRADWLLWLLGATGADHKMIVLVACDLGRTALAHVPAGEDRPRLAIEAAEGWVRGEVGIAEVRVAAVAAYAAAYAGCAGYAANAGYAAASAAANAADAAASAAANAADAAADAAADTANAAAHAAAGAVNAAADAADAAYAACAAANGTYAASAVVPRLADIVRTRFPLPPEVPA